MIKRYFLAGLLVWLPIWATLLVLGFLVGIMDKSLALLPNAYQPDKVFGTHIPGIGVIFSLLILFFTGMVARNYFGKRLVAFGEKIVEKIPLVRTIYSAVKKVLHTLFAQDGQSFRKVLLVEYPRKGLWSIAFQTSSGFKEAEQKTGEEMITIFVPTTPNPTSGFLMFVPRRDTVELELTVDEALRMVISLGVVLPGVEPILED